MKRFLLSIALIFCAVSPAAAATVDGIPIHFTATGKGPKTVVFVHGWTCDETTWTAQTPALGKQYSVVTLDLPGHGKSGSPKDGKFTMDLFARAVESVRAEVKAERVVLVGHSMGTPVIVQYARLYPQRVSSLVFVDGLVSMGPGGPPAMPPLAGEGGQANREKMVKGMVATVTPPDLQARIQKMMLAPPQATAVGAMTAMFDPAIWKDDVMTMPVLGLYADKSSVGNQGYMKEHYPAMEYHEIPGTDHFLMLEKPDEFNRLLLEFLAKH